MELLKYAFFPSNVILSGQVAILENCNSWTAINQGADVAKVGGITLHPGQIIDGIQQAGDSWGIVGHMGEVFNRQAVPVTFLTIVNPLVEFVQKVYEFKR